MVWLGGVGLPIEEFILFFDEGGVERVVLYINLGLLILFFIFLGCCGVVWSSVVWLCVVWCAVVCCCVLEGENLNGLYYFEAIFFSGGL